MRRDVGYLVGALAALVGGAWVTAAQAAPAARDRVSIVGSSTLFPFASVVAETFGRRGPWKTPVVESTGTGGGFRVFCRGVGADTPDITDASRPMTDEERARCASNRVGPVVGLRVGADGILMANSRLGPPFVLTRRQIFLAVAKTVPLNGRIVANPFRRWREIDAGLPDLPIKVYGPAPNHGTRDAFVALVMAPPCERLTEVRALSKEAQRTLCQAVREDGAWIDISGDYALVLGRLVADREAVGILGYSFLDQNRGKIQAAQIDGVAPTLESIGTGLYPLSRPLYLYVKRAHVGKVPGLAEFLAEFLSERAAGPNGYLVEKGLAPQPKSWLELERRKAAALSAPP
jgi:phosphate transport system substrate-binding protein